MIRRSALVSGGYIKILTKEKTKEKTQSSFDKAFLLKKRFVIGSRFIGDKKEENKKKMLFVRLQGKSAKFHCQSWCEGKSKRFTKHFLLEKV